MSNRTNTSPQKWGETPASSMEVPGYREKMRMREIRREMANRAVRRKYLFEKHGQLEPGWEWEENPETGAVRSVRMKTGGQKPRPRTDAQIKEAARKVVPTGYDEFGNAIRWATQDNAYIILRKWSVGFDMYYFEYGKPAMLPDGQHIDFLTIEEKVGQTPVFLRAKKALAGLEDVDIRSLRGHSIIDPGGQKMPPLNAPPQMLTEADYPELMEMLPKDAWPDEVVLWAEKQKGKS